MCCFVELCRLLPSISTNVCLFVSGQTQIMPCVASVTQSCMLTWGHYGLGLGLPHLAALHHFVTVQRRSYISCCCSRFRCSVSSFAFGPLRSPCESSKIVCHVCSYLRAHISYAPCVLMADCISHQSILRLCYHICTFASCSHGVSRLLTHPLIQVAFLISHCLCHLIVCLCLLRHSNTLAILTSEATSKALF